MRSFLCGVAARINASVLPRRCNPIPVQLPTLSIGTVILPHCACAPRNAPLSSVLLSQNCSVSEPHLFGWCREARADDVMHEMREVPVGHEQAEQSAMEQRIAVKVGKAFPRNDRLQRRRLVIGDEPLVDGEIGYAQ